MFERQIKFIDDLQSDIAKILMETVHEYDFVIKDFVINKQLFREGVDGNGKKLPGYKRTTIRLKIIKGDPADRMTLRDKGTFYSHIFINAYPDRFEVISDVDYDIYLVKRLGKAILKPSHENMAEFIRNYYLPKLKEHVKNKFAK